MATSGREVSAGTLAGVSAQKPNADLVGTAQLRPVRDSGLWPTGEASCPGISLSETKTGAVSACLDHAIPAFAGS
jgi:hypothetical protein